MPERLAGYHEAQLESLKYRMFSPAPIYPAMEIARLDRLARAIPGGAGRR